MIRILFVCHGNICRSPMAEFVMKDIVSRGSSDLRFRIESAATSTEEIGNPVYPPARKKLAEHRIGCAGHSARQMQRQDYERFDLLIGMDPWNIKNMTRICGGDPEQKIHMLLDYAGRPGEEVADPWYTRDFEATWQDVLQGCTALYEMIARVAEMEALRLEIDETLERIEEFLDGEEAEAAIEGIRPKVGALSDYYGSDLWRHDFEADEAGRVPKSLPRGVLSEDEAYNTLTKWSELTGA